MGNVNSANPPKQETPPLNPDNQPVLGPVDWSVVLEFLKDQEYENAAKHMSERDEKYKKSLSNMDYGTLMKDRLEHIFKSQIFQSIVDNHFKDAAVFSILYFETGGDRDIILEFIFTHAGRTIKQISEETETKVSQKNTLNGLKNYPEIIGQFLNQSMSNILSYSFLLESYDIKNYLKFLKSLQIPKLKPEQTSIQEHCIKFINNFQLTRNLDYFLRLVRLDKIESKDSNNLVSFLTEIVVVVHYVDKYKEFLRAQYEVCIAILSILDSIYLRFYLLISLFYLLISFIY
jgi:hypothetical protein